MHQKFEINVTHQFYVIIYTLLATVKSNHSKFALYIKIEKKKKTQKFTTYKRKLTFT